jgi:hypothetical protein
MLSCGKYSPAVNYQKNQNNSNILLPLSNEYENASSWKIIRCTKAYIYLKM